MPPALTATGNGIDESRLEVLRGRYSYASISDKISDIVLTRPTHWGWYAGLALCTALTVLFVVAIAYLFATGVGIWGVDIPVAWAFAITNFVWWVGIGHAGTF
ncbi:MAG TPA: hypothetical protein VLN42_02450, partial [Casimicrobiaceae bacterium]|nr:hypothetical protein [Casimicrobiaceae bacterium]